MATATATAADASGPAEAGERQILHATTVAVDGRALVIAGPSGSGKSGLALAMMALGADLVADDRTVIVPRPDGPPLATAPEALRGLVEARGVGLLAADYVRWAVVHAMLDMGEVETRRLPEARHIRLAGVDLPLLHKAEIPHFAAALVQYLKGGRRDP